MLPNASVRGCSTRRCRSERRPAWNIRVHVAGSSRACSSEAPSRWGKPTWTAGGTARISRASSSASCGGASSGRSGPSWNGPAASTTCAAGCSSCRIATDRIGWCTPTMTFARALRGHARQDMAYSCASGPRPTPWTRHSGPSWTWCAASSESARRTACSISDAASDRSPGCGGELRLLGGRGELSSVQVSIRRQFCRGLPVEIHHCDYRDVDAYARVDGSTRSCRSRCSRRSATGATGAIWSSYTSC